MNNNSFVPGTGALRRVLCSSRAEGLANEIHMCLGLKANIARELAALLKQWDALKLKPLKQWLAEESARAHITPNSVFCRLKAGKYPRVHRVRLNQRLVWVVEDNAR